MIQQDLQSIFTKINAITEGSSTLNALERDLVKDYLLQAYRIVEDVQLDSAKSVSLPASAPVKEVITPHVSVEKVKVAVRREPVEPLPQPPEVTEPEEVPAIEVENIREPVVGQPSSSKTAPLEPKSNGHTAVSDDALATLMEPPAIDKKYAEIFEWEEGKDLSDQLSKASITDLHRGFGINDRLRYQNDLFRSDTTAFNEAIDTLNRKPDFLSAKAFIARNLIDRYDWLAESRISTAREFIRLISRRFS